MFCNAFGRTGGFGQESYIGYGGMFIGMAFKMIVFIALIVIACKLFKIYINKSNSGVKVLNERYASGEIDEEEYLKRKAVLFQRK